ncbi:glutamate racemase [Blattabacterium cuenoti]|uniref:glutamate racemase n=1 Tax=Blattabacterium cuenoti TaxID=1653831 RepID=UPI00163BE27A|nr:glutamate racemase [Blattabacterium cuenoti]
MKIDAPIGIFDSGIGGVIIAKEITMQMPNENIIYFGDTMNMPYGEKSKDFIIKNSIKIVSFFLKKKCKAIVIACNSVTSNALEEIKKKFNRKFIIFNVIEPIVKNKILLTSNRIGIIATPATIRSNFYVKEINKYYHHLDIIQVSAPLLAPMIEKGIEIIKIKNIIKNYLNNLKSIDTLLLACTHYLFFKKEIENLYYGRVHIHIIDIQKIVVQEIKKILKEKKLYSTTTSSSYHHKKLEIFYTSTFIPCFFKKKIYTLFGKDILFKRYVFN